MIKKIAFLLLILSINFSQAMEQSAQLASVSAYNAVLERLISLNKWLSWSAIPEDAQSKKLYTDAIDAQTILKTKFDAVHQQIDRNPDQLPSAEDYDALLTAFTKFSNAVEKFNDDKLAYNEWWQQHCLPYRSDISDSDEE